MDDILDLRWHYFVIKHDDRPPLTIINKVGLLHVVLPILLSFPCFHAFHDVAPNIIWDANSSRMEEPNVDEQERTMGFHTTTTTMQKLSKGTHKQILGQVMDIICLTWIFILCWAEQVRFALSFLPTHLYFTFVAPTFRLGMLVQRGGGHPWHLWDQGFMGNGREVFYVRPHGILVLCHLLHNNHRFRLQPRVLGMFHHLSPKYKWP